MNVSQSVSSCAGIALAFAQFLQVISCAWEDRNTTGKSRAADFRIVQLKAYSDGR